MLVGAKHLEVDPLFTRYFRGASATRFRGASPATSGAASLTNSVSGGAALFAPDQVRENFRPSTSCGGHDGEGRGLRYLEWSWDPDPSDTTCVADYAYLPRESDGSVRVECERHVARLLPRADWLRLLSEVGFHPRVVPFEHSELEPGTYESFVGSRPPE